MNFAQWLSRCFPWAVACGLALALIAVGATGQERRIALVIGNGAYASSLPRLANPPNDAEDMAKALRQFGFQVIERKNLTLEGMNRAIAEFGSKIGGSEAALFYFAGHGIQVKNQNYLIPVNATIDSEAAVPYQGINVNQVLDEMENGHSRVNIVMLDACRNNPLTGKFRSGQTRGLAAPSSSPKGTVIVYATDPGNVAADGEGRNGLFTAGLLAAFRGKDLSLDGVLTKASSHVEEVSGQTQTPYVNGPKTVQKTFHFNITVEPGQAEVERTFWKSIERSTDPADYEAYLAKYPGGSYAPLAENRIKTLKPAPSAPAPAAPAGNPTAAFDGRWGVSLVCEEVTYNGRTAKGYTFSFPADVKDGRLSGQFGQVGQPGSLTLTGTIQADGRAEITARGLTGNPDYAVGRLTTGSPVLYHLRGTFTATKGRATRLELRPCEAAFSKE